MDNERRWYEKAGEAGDVVVSTRVRLARNLRDIPFPSRMNAAQRAESERRVRDALFQSNSPIAGDFDFLQMDAMSEQQAGSLVEKHLISPQFAANGKGRGVLISKDESISIMVNEEDHVRIQVLREGLALCETAETADRIDTLLNESLHFAFDEELGYLTQCPTNLGTGMRASVMLHLPALAERGALSRIVSNLSKLGLVTRGTYGEGTGITGAMVQLSNQITLGLSETEAVENLRNIAKQLVDAERESRAALLGQIRVQDRIARALGVLQTARLLSGEEFMRLSSEVRFGVTAGMLSGIDLADLNALTASVQPATLSAKAGKALSAEERDVLRAETVRKALRGVA